MNVEFTDENPATANAVWEKLPIEGKANLWGGEIYFKIPVAVEAEASKQLVQVGDVAYWPLGNAICFIFSQLHIAETRRYALRVPSTSSH
jgi:hypothetical protein